MNAKSETDIGDLRAEMEQLRTDLSKIGETLKAIATERAEATYERARGAAREAEARATQTAEAVGEEISARPFTSVATAFGVGILLGMLFTRRS